MNSKRKFRLRALVLRWHHRIGAAAAMFAIFLSVTGILLNHSSDWDWDKRFISQPWLLNLYGIDLEPDITAFKAGDKWVSQLDTLSLFVNETTITRCRKPLVGAVVTQELLVAHCGDLILLTPEGELVEIIPATAEWSQAIQIGTFRNRLLMNLEDRLLSMNLDDLSVAEVENVTYNWSKPQPLPPGLKDIISSNYAGDGISYERLLQDLHSGRIMGSFGIYFADLVGVAIILLALSGFWVWWRRG